MDIYGEFESAEDKKQKEEIKILEEKVVEKSKEENKEENKDNTCSYRRCKPKENVENKEDKKPVEVSKIEIKEKEEDNLNINYMEKLKKEEIQNHIDKDLENLNPGWVLFKGDPLTREIITKKHTTSQHHNLRKTRIIRHRIQRITIKQLNRPKHRTINMIQQNQSITHTITHTNP